MKRPNQTLTSESGQIALHLFDNPSYVICEQQNLKKVNSHEFINALHLLGNNLQLLATGRVLADYSNLSNNKLTHSVAAVGNGNKAILQKVPYFLLAILKSKNFLVNLQLQATLSTAKSLSTKLLDAKMFNNKEEALKWLLEYPVPDTIRK